MRSNKFFHSILVAAVVLTFSEASSADSDILVKSRAAQFSIKSGKTRKSEILGFFGKPFFERTIQDKECWFYKSGMKVRSAEKKNYLIFFQFSDAGVVENVLLVMPGAIPALGKKVWEYRLEHDELGTQWRANLEKYGHPEKVFFSGEKIVWRCDTQEKVVSREDIFHGLAARTVLVESRIVEFDDSGRMLKDYVSRKEVPRLEVKVTEDLPESRKEVLRDMSEEILSGPKAGLIIYEDETGAKGKVPSVER
ncbi:MAG: hypothetical protein GF409_00295 [Candidatus Omnitrophica bacterium]|nr:hypothetical protein [Candidatus Omnitrophota bacterium]